MVNNTNVMSIAPNQPTSPRRISPGTRPKYKPASRADKGNFGSTLDKIHAKLDELKQSVQDLQDANKKIAQVDDELKPQQDEVKETQAQGTSENPQEAETAISNDSEVIAEKDVKPADIFFAEDKPVAVNVKLELADAPEAPTIQKLSPRPEVQSVEIQPTASATEPVNLATSADLVDEQSPANFLAASSMAYLFGTNKETLLATKPAAPDEAPKVDAVQNLMSLMPQDDKGNAQSMLNLLGGRTWRPVEVQAQPADVQPLQIQPSVRPQAVDFQPLQIQPSVQPQAVDFQPAQIQPSVQPQAVDVQPAQVQPTVQPQAVDVQPAQIQPSVQPQAVDVQPLQIQPSVQPQAVDVQPLQIQPSVQPQPIDVQPLQIQPTVQPQAVDVQPAQIQPTVQPQPVDVQSAQIQPTVQPQVVDVQPTQIQPTVQPQVVDVQPAQVQPTVQAQVADVQPTQVQPTVQAQVVDVQPAQVQPTVQAQPIIAPQRVDERPAQQIFSELLGVNVQVEDAPTAAPVTPPQSPPQQFNQQQQPQQQDAQNFQNQLFQATAEITQAQPVSTGGEVFTVPLTANDAPQPQQPAPAQAPDAPPPPPQENFDVPAQIVRQARLIRTTENTEMVIKLNPEHLGELTLRVSVSANGAVNASFHSDNAQVRTIIENSLVQLRQELNDAGLKVENVDVYAGLSEDGLMNGQGGQAWQQGRQQRQGNRQIDLNSIERDIDSTVPVNQSTDDGVDYSV